MAQHGAAGATHGQRQDEAEGPRQFSPEERRKYEERQARRAAAEERIVGLRDEARAAIDRAGNSDSPGGDGPFATRRPLPGRPPRRPDVRKELIRALGQDDGEKAWNRYMRAGKEFRREQFADARKTMRPLVEACPDLSDFRELYGLTLYRLGRWTEAIDQLELFRTLSGTTEQHAVLMDAHRALAHWQDIDELWVELAEHSPAGPEAIEARIVRAGAEADRGELNSAIRILEKGWKPPRHPEEHHLRRGYALADLYERAGKLPRSRALFEWVAASDAEFGDAGHRARSLR